MTIGRGVESEICQYDNGSTYKNALAAKILVDMATDSLDDNGHCLSSSAIDTENADGDHFLCEAKDGSSLAPLFKQVAEMLTSGSKLVPVFEWSAGWRALTSASPGRPRVLPPRIVSRW